MATELGLGIQCWDLLLDSVLLCWAACGGPALSSLLAGFLVAQGALTCQGSPHPEAELRWPAGPITIAGKFYSCPRVIFFSYSFFVCFVFKSF